MFLSTKEFESHAVWTELNSVHALLDQSLSLEGIDSECASRITRLKAVASFSKVRIKNIDLNLIQSELLNKLTGKFNSISSHLLGFIDRKDINSLIAADAEADLALNEVALINLEITSQEFENAQEVARSYKDVVNSFIFELSKVAKDFETKKSSLREEIDAMWHQTVELKADIGTTTNSFRDRFNDAENSRASQWTDVQATRSQEFEKLLKQATDSFSEQWETLKKLKSDTEDKFAQASEEQKKTFSDVQSMYQDVFNNQTTEFEKFKSAVLKEHDNHLDLMRQGFEVQATEMLEKITKLKKEADDLVGIIGDRGVTSGHQKAAEQARTDAQIWQIATVISMIALIVLAVYIFLPQVAGVFSWESFAGRVFITFTIGVLATYAGAQADKYQKIERHSRTMALELQAIGPFIAPLPQEKQHEFRLMIGERSFGNDSAEKSKPVEKSPTSVADLLGKPQDISSIVKSAVEAIKEVGKLKD